MIALSVILSLIGASCLVIACCFARQRRLRCLRARNSSNSSSVSLAKSAAPRVTGNSSPSVSVSRASDVSVSGIGDRIADTLVHIPLREGESSESGALTSDASASTTAASESAEGATAHADDGRLHIINFATPPPPTSIADISAT